jgi:ABC-type amino acid transport substrate-binding protein
MALLFAAKINVMIRGGALGEEKGLTVDLGREGGRRLGASPARTKDMDFSGPILAAELGYPVPAHSPIATLADVDRAGVRVGVTAGSSSQATLSREFAHASVVPAPSLQAAVAMLAAGQIDA